MRDIRCVYFMVASNAVKIGCTKDLSTRCKSVQSMCPELLDVRYWVVDDIYREESLFHVKYDSLRMHGEWFQKSSELMSDIDKYEYYKFTPPAHKFAGLSKRLYHNFRRTGLTEEIFLRIWKKDKILYRGNKYIKIEDSIREKRRLDLSYVGSHNIHCNLHRIEEIKDKIERLEVVYDFERQFVDKWSSYQDALYLLEAK